MHFLLLDAETNIKKLPDLLDWIASVLSGERLEITSKQQHLWTYRWCEARWQCRETNGCTEPGDASWRRNHWCFSFEPGRTLSVGINWGSLNYPKDIVLTVNHLYIYDNYIELLLKSYTSQHVHSWNSWHIIIMKFNLWWVNWWLSQIIEIWFKVNNTQEKHKVAANSKHLGLNKKLIMWYDKWKVLKRIVC